MKKKQHLNYPIVLFCTLALLFYAQSCSVPQKKVVKKEDASHDKFADHVRTTDFQTPEQEKAGFKLPEGFEITLFASEPDITKPINMEFDDRGRLWVTQSSEYPMPAGPGAGKDRITILEDTNGDGKADKFDHFDDNLNIPIGIMPVNDGAIAFSIPNIYHFTDTNNDGISDKKDVLFGEFGYRDTHGMVSNLMRGFDGWIYACHGFTNTSTVKGTDGHSITMSSGNTFRFRKDGSRIEQTTFGRVNPFGYAYDERGYLYSVDCHSKPIYQLIPGAEYPHFGKKETGIGFAPEMMSYELGSTALSGLVYYTGQQFPEEYRQSFYTGDVVTCRIDRNTVSYNGSTPVAKKETPFLTSADPWFRPVDVKTGPDGALYIADFYNRIIGHYEISLDHPGRDRTSGRIWKITYKGDKDHKNIPVKDWSKADLKELIDGLQHPHLSTRMKIADRLVDQWKDKAIAPVKSKVESDNSGDPSFIHGLWVLHRLNALPDATLNSALKHTNATARLHAFRILSDKKSLSDAHRTLVVTALADSDPFIRRTAAEILTKFPKSASLKPLITLYEQTDAADSHLKYTALLAIRETLRSKGGMWSVPGTNWNENQLSILIKVLTDVPSSESASFVLDYLLTHDVAPNLLASSMEFVGRYAAPYQLDQSIGLIRKKFASDYDTQLSLYSTIKSGVVQSGASPSPLLKEWGTSLASHFLQTVSSETDLWKSKPIVKNTEYASPWLVTDQFLTDIMPAFRIYLSEKKGYLPRAVLYTVPFKLPATLSMNVFDNDIDNSPNKIGISKNSVRIRLAGSNKVIGEYRLNQKTTGQWKDLIKNTTFDLNAYQGQLGYIEAIDSSQTGSIGIGKLEPAVVAMPDKTPSDLDDLRLRAAEIAGEYKVAALEPQLQSLVKASWAHYNVRAAAANALVNISPKRNTALLGELFTDKSESALFREKLASTLGQAPSPEVFDLLEKGLAGSARNIQVVTATVLANSETGINHLLNALKEENINADILSEVRVKERLANAIKPTQQQQLDKLTAGGANEREERQKLIEARLAGFKATGTQVAAGQTIFTQNCSMCHQIKGAGGLIGPQLDGIGNWGPKALTEKILDPNRNISEAFRNYTITLKNEKVLTGLYRRTEGQALVFADPNGQEFSVPKDDIKEYKPSKYTLMPDQFRHTIQEKDYYALLEYLLNVK